MADTKEKIVIISGPSGSGKNSVLQGVLDTCENCVRLVTATTRAIREGEQDGVDYHFLRKDQFLKGIENGDIPEHWRADETDRYYGTYMPALKERLAEGKTVLAQLQIEGLRYFKKKFGAVGIFVVADSYDELERRIRTRQPDMTDEEIEERLHTARQEVDEYSDEYDFTVVNARGKLDEAINQVIDIIRKEQYL